LHDCNTFQVMHLSGANSAGSNNQTEMVFAETGSALCCCHLLAYDGATYFQGCSFKKVLKKRGETENRNQLFLTVWLTSHNTMWSLTSSERLKVRHFLDSAVVVGRGETLILRVVHMNWEVCAVSLTNKFTGYVARGCFWKGKVLMITSFLESAVRKRFWTKNDDNCCQSILQLHGVLLHFIFIVM